MVREALESEIGREKPLSEPLPGLLVSRASHATGGRRIEVRAIVFELDVNRRVEYVRRTIEGEVRGFLSRIVAAILGDAVPLRPPPTSLAEARQRPGVGPVGVIAPEWCLAGALGIPFRPVASSKALESEPESQIILVYPSTASYLLHIDVDVERHGPDHRVALTANVSAASPERPRIARVGMPMVGE